MKEIKFRAWSTEDKEMLHDVQDMYDHIEDCFGDLLSDNYFLKDKYKVMQYTGLKDKNDVETYSGDIVSDGINPPFVVDLWNWALMIRLTEIEFEVIGNLYENPELLKDN